MEKLLRMSLLFDLYGALLTEKQRCCLEMHLLNDLSLTEIAEELKVSRQAVYDILHRSEQVLDDYESKLGLAARYQKERREIETIRNLLDKLPTDMKCQTMLDKAKQMLGQLIGKTEEADNR